MSRTIDRTRLMDDLSKIAGAENMIGPWIARTCRDALALLTEEVKEPATGKLTTEEVSRVTGIDKLSLRVGLQRGFWPFGVAYKRPGSSQYTYEYFPDGVIKYVANRKALAEGMEDGTTP